MALARIDVNDMDWMWISEVIPGPHQEPISFDEIYARLKEPSMPKSKAMTMLNILVDEEEVAMFGEPIMRMGQHSLRCYYRWLDLEAS